MITIKYGSTKKVLLIYPTASQNDHGCPNSARALLNLLGHFSVLCTLCPSAEYKAGRLNEFDHVFYLGIQEEQLPGDLLNDLADTKSTICWIGNNLEQLLQAGQLAATIVSKSFAIQGSIRYRQRDLPCNQSSLIQLNTAGQVWAWLKTGNRIYPYAFQIRRLWVFTADPLTFQDGGYWVLADLLHDFLGEPHSHQNQALIRIEDVHPLIDPVSLWNIGEYLAQENIPFLVALIPVYANGANSQWIPMSERPDFVQAISDLVTKGAMLVLHGYTHQHGLEETAVGFEFWDDLSDCPLPNDTWHFAESRLRRGLQECAANNLWPLAFEPPHYAISSLDYRVAHAHFSTLVGREQLSDQTYQIAQPFPYPIGRDQYGNRWFPENLGYVNPDTGQTVDSMLAAAQQIQVVRDSIVGAFFHPFMPLDLLKQLVNGLRGLGFSFADLRNQSHTVRWSNQVVYNQGPDILVSRVSSPLP